MNSSYVPLSSPPQASTSSLAAPAFDDILKRVQSANVRNQGDDRPAALNKTPIDKSDRLYELCEELETFLIKNLVKSMRSTVQKSKLIDTGFAGEMYEDMLYDEYAKAFSRNANFGFAEMAYRDLAGMR